MTRRALLTAVCVTAAIATETQTGRDGPVRWIAAQERPNVRVETGGRSELPSAPGEPKRWVLRYPAEPGRWNGRLVIGVHGGTGGVLRDEHGEPIGTSETALDDVVGSFATASGFAYASLDRDGIGGTPDGLALTKEFLDLARSRLIQAFNRSPERVYAVGFSMGGGIVRQAVEESPASFNGALIIAGAGGDAGVRLERQARMAALWPEIDPRGAPSVPDADPRVRAYAEISGTPVAARPLWPYAAASATFDQVRQSLRANGLPDLTDEQLADFQVERYADHAPFMAALASENTTGRVTVPTIEIVGTHDDLVIREIRAYKSKVLAAGAGNRHRLYLVDGAWHVSPDDDAMGTFVFAMNRMGLPPGTQEAARRTTPYIPIVQDLLCTLDAWVADGVSPPPDRTLTN